LFVPTIACVVVANIFQFVPYSGFFQMTDPAPVPLETSFLQQTITSTSSAFSFSAESHGHEQLYAQLQQAGAQGYSLASVFDDPSNHEMEVCGQVTMHTPLIAVLHRNPTAWAPTQYQVVNCPIHVQLNCGSIHASMPYLDQQLQEYGSQGWRLGGCYLPHAHFHRGLAQVDMPCHLIFEHDPSNAYGYQVQEMSWTLSTVCRIQPDVNIEQVSQAASAAANAGWEVACVINLPAMRSVFSAACGEHSYPVLLVSQCKQAMGYAPQAIPVQGVPVQGGMQMQMPPPPPPPPAGTLPDRTCCEVQVPVKG